MARKKSASTIPSVLSFEKKLVPSDGYMYGTTWENRYESAQPLLIKEKTIRGTIGNRLKESVANDPAKLNAEIEKSNIQKVDACYLRENQDTLKIHFTLKVLGNLQEPSTCNDKNFLERYKNKVREYVETEGFEELGRRYALNIANGRFLWRNRVGASEVEVVVKSNPNEEGVGEKEWKFNAKSYPLRNFKEFDEKVSELGSLIAKTLSGDEESFLILDIVCYAKVGEAQEVYPSEEFVDSPKTKSKNEKSKTLYEIDGQAAMHSQKIGNAIRTIDTWYSAYEEEGYPISIEPYGTVTTKGTAFRIPAKKEDFFTLFDMMMEGEGLEREQAHYVMGTLVRGGVFGAKGQEE